MCDVGERADVEALADFAWERHGQVDAIVNNAGIGPIFSSVIDADLNDIRKLHDINVIGVWNGISIFGKRFLEQKTPCAIYSVGSENSFFLVVSHAAGYVASKHAVHGIMDSLRQEVPDHIEVGLICPGFVQSEIGEGTEAGMPADEYVEIVYEQMLAGTFYIVSHPYNMVRIAERFNEVEAAYVRYAPPNAGGRLLRCPQFAGEFGYSESSDLIFS